MVEWKQGRNTVGTELYSVYTFDVGLSNAQTACLVDRIVGRAAKQRLSE